MKIITSIAMLITGIALSACSYTGAFDSQKELNERYKEQRTLYLSNEGDQSPSGWAARKKYLPRAMRKATFSGMPTGDDSYSMGFQNGCDTSLSVMGEGFFRFKDPKFDTERLTGDAWYLRGFDDGMTYCTFRIDWEVH